MVNNKESLFYRWQMPSSQTRLNFFSPLKHILIPLATKSIAPTFSRDKNYTLHACCRNCSFSLCKDWSCLCTLHLKLTLHPYHSSKGTYKSGGGSTNLNNWVCSSTMGYWPKILEDSPTHTNCCSADSTKGKKYTKNTHNHTMIVSKKYIIFLQKPIKKTRQCLSTDPADHARICGPWPTMATTDTKFGVESL